LLKRTLIQISDPGTILSDLTGLQEMSNGSRDSYSREKRYERKDGSHVWCSVNVSLLRGPDPDCDCFVVVLHDISARKEIEEDLARTNELLTISQNAGGTGSFEWIVPENSLTWSQNHIDMFGLSSSGFDGSFAAWQKCVGADDLAKVEAEIQSAFLAAERTGTPSIELSWRTLPKNVGSLRVAAFHTIRAASLISWSASLSTPRSAAKGAPFRVIQRSAATNHLSSITTPRSLQQTKPGAPSFVPQKDGRFRELRYNAIRPEIRQVARMLAAGIITAQCAPRLNWKEPSNFWKNFVREG
jgi:hypothetical protein